MSNKKVALVTGAASGIGKACAFSLARKDFIIAANYRTREPEIKQLLEELQDSEHLSFKADVADKIEVQELVSNVINKYGRLDLLVNVAGIYEEHEIDKVDFETWNNAWEKNIQINLYGPMNLAYCASQQMIKQKGGKIINITSRGAFRGEPKSPAYGAAKAGLNSASQSLAQSLGPFGIYVYAIAPGWVETPLAEDFLHGTQGETIKNQSPLKRVARPSEIGNLVAYLAGEETDYLTGSIIDVNGASYLRN